jgi:hypothetical protein
MVVSKFNVLGLFHTFNEEYFSGVLPIPNFKISHSYKTLGYFHCEVDDFGNTSDETIEISGNYDFTESQVRDVLVHEMIHYYLLYMGIDKKCKHGKEFKKMCKEFNSKYNMNLSVTIDLSNYKIKEGNSNFMFKLCTLF